MTIQFTEEAVHIKVLSSHTSPLVMLREHFLRERAKRLILTNHLGDIRLHKQRKGLPRHILRAWSCADADTMRGGTQSARGGNLQRLAGLEREAVGRDRDLCECAAARADVQPGRRRGRRDGHDGAAVRAVRQVDRRAQAGQAAGPAGRREQSRIARRGKPCSQGVVQVEAAPAVDRLVVAREGVLRRGREVVKQSCLCSLRS